MVLPRSCESVYWRELRKLWISVLVAVLPAGHLELRTHGYGLAGVVLHYIPVAA